MRSSQLEVLHSLGYPVYVRTSLLEASAQQRAKQGNKTSATVDEVRATARQVAKTMPAEAQHATPPDARWLRLSIGLVASDQALAVFDCPAGDVAVHRSLVENMLRKCGCSLKELPFAHFIWPVVDNPKVRQGEEEASRALAAMQQKLLASDHAWLIVSGEKARNIFDATSFAKRVIYLPSSTAQMIDAPALRKQCWQALLPLREGLQKR